MKGTVVEEMVVEGPIVVTTVERFVNDKMVVEGSVAENMVNDIDREKVMLY